MIGIETNVLVRYLAQDDRGQSALATRLFEHTLTKDNPGFVSVVALVETAWVLERTYRVRGAALANVIERLLQVDTLILDREAEAARAIAPVHADTASFADALIAELGAAAGCTHSVAFDRRALRLSGYRAIEPILPLPPDERSRFV